MNKLLAASVQRICAAGGRLDACADFDDLLNLNRLSEAALGTEHRDPRYGDALYPALIFAGQTFQRVSIGVRIFAEECVEVWFRDDTRLRELAWCYLMAHARQPEIVWAHQADGPARFRERLHLWLRGIAATDEEMLFAIDEWLTKGRKAAKAGEADRTEQQQDLSEALEELAAEYGEPDLLVWLWKKPESEVSLLYDRMRERKARQDGAYVSRGSDKFHTAMADYRRAELEFSEKVIKRGIGCHPHRLDDDRKSDRQQVSHREAPP